MHRYSIGEDMMRTTITLPLAMIEENTNEVDNTHDDEYENIVKQSIDDHGKRYKF
jgi:hypothetical protein